MGRNLHYSIPRFFEKSLDEHPMVISWERIDHPQNDSDYIYRIIRAKNFVEIFVHATDKYDYSLTDYYQKPEQLGTSSFIYVARPEATYDPSIVEYARQDNISIGKFGAIMGALYKEDHWNEY